MNCGCGISPGRKQGQSQYPDMSGATGTARVVGSDTNYSSSATRPGESLNFAMTFLNRHLQSAIGNRLLHFFITGFALTDPEG